MELTAQTIASLRLVLKKIAFLEHLKVSELDQLIHAMDKRPFKRGETIIKQGDHGETFYILGSGSVLVYRKSGFFGRNRQVATLKKEAFFGEMALIDDIERTATVIGEEDGDLYFLPREAFKKVLLNNPGIAELIKKTAQYRATQNKVIEIGDSDS